MKYGVAGILDGEPGRYSLDLLNGPPLLFFPDKLNAQEKWVIFDCVGSGVNVCKLREVEPRPQGDLAAWRERTRPQWQRDRA